MRFSTLSIACLLAAAMSLLALAKLPYGYYTLLRLVVCAVGISACIRFATSRQSGHAAAAGFMSLVYNPLIPVYLDRETWAVVNIATVLSCCYFSWRLSRTSPSNEGRSMRQ